MDPQYLFVGPQYLLAGLPQVSLTAQLIVLGLLLGSGLWAASRPGALSMVALVACAAVWSRANSHLEGAVLITFTRDHGLTLADLLLPAVAALVLARAPRRPKSSILESERV